MKGKEKCKILKEIRRQIAEENDIPFVVSQCSHKGDCKGTCPKCESELRYLERELAIRQNLGKVVAIAGISMGTCAALTACTSKDIDTNNNMIGEETDELSGDMEYIEEPVETEQCPIPYDTDQSETTEPEEPSSETDVLAGDIAIE